jgi:uncharacterized protein
VNADPAAQVRLLDLQAADTALAQLAHRRASLPELAALAERDTRARQLEDDAVELRTRRDDVDAEQRRMEREIDAVRSRASRDDQRLTSGGLPAKELEGLQHEITTLARRQSSLEDDLLELMEQLEDLDGKVAAVATEQSELDADRAALTSARDAAFSQIDASVTRRATERAEIARELPADLVTLYERIRTANGGVGAAALRHRRCEGCRIELAGNELSAVRAAAPDAIVRCENCRRILVRTADSGV